MSLAYYQDTLPRLVREQGKHLQSGDFDRAIRAALLQYSQDAPRQLVGTVAWSQEGHFNFNLPPGLTVESTLLDAEYPIGQVPRASASMTMYVTDGPLGVLCEQRLPEGAQVRLYYTAPHQVADVPEPVDTVPQRHRDAVCDYAAHLLCRELATLFSAERESGISADGSNTESRARNYSQRARELRQSYYATLGKNDPMTQVRGNGTGAVVAAGGVVSWGRQTRPWFTTNDPLLRR